MDGVVTYPPPGAVPVVWTVYTWSTLMVTLLPRTELIAPWSAVTAPSGARAVRFTVLLFTPAMAALSWLTSAELAVAVIFTFLFCRPVMSFWTVLIAEATEEPESPFPWSMLPRIALVSPALAFTPARSAAMLLAADWNPLVLTPPPIAVLNFCASADICGRPAAP